MKKSMLLALAAVIAIFSAIGAHKAQAQIGIGIGVEPACPYGYYDYAPYNCSPYGYYGREWFNGRTFIGVGPWFHGANEFHGHVNNSYDPQHGYNGRMPNNGERATRHTAAPRRFKGNEERDGRGHVSGGNRGGEERR
jgi:hypothetical protein